MDNQQLKKSITRNIFAIHQFVESCRETMFRYGETKSDELLLTDWVISVYEYDGEIVNPTGDFMYFAWLKTKKDQLKTLRESADFAIKQYHNLSESDDLILSSHDINYYKKDKSHDYELMMALERLKDFDLLDLEKELDDSIECVKPDIKPTSAINSEVFIDRNPYLNRERRPSPTKVLTSKELAFLISAFQQQQLITVRENNKWIAEAIAPLCGFSHKQFEETLSAPTLTDEGIENLKFFLKKVIDKLGQ